MAQQVDERVHDRIVIDEIRLTGDLIIAASEHAGPFTQNEIDVLLGVA